MALLQAAVDVKVADEVWIAMALLHHENPLRQDFSLAEIVDRASREGLVLPLRPGVYAHASGHSVANKPAGANYRMLFETVPGRRRLLRDGDSWDPSRSGKIVPNREEIPEKYHWLLDWYGKWAKAPINSMIRGIGPGTSGLNPGRFDGLLRLRGAWKGAQFDAYVKRMREDWD
jgi:hypothetical protein